MCGICGKLSFDNEPVSEVLLKAMNDTMYHRGPDDSGCFVDGGFGFAMKRLSIIDLKKGQQPIFNENREIGVILNGEIYNFSELKNQLVKKGHIFSTDTDTETIVHLYEEKGEGFVEYLRGMFGVAIWDRRKRKLVLARDRFGKKPLFYYTGKNYLVFGSEIKAILKHGGIDTNIDMKALSDYFTFSWIVCPHTIYSKIKQLPPAHLLVIENGKINIKKYWEFVITEQQIQNEEQCAEKLIEELREAIKIRLKSDVPLGALLSGGVDSSIIVALMSGLCEKQVKTFSIGFNNVRYDELKYARIISKIFGTDHHEFIVTPDTENIIEKIICQFDEPFADASAIPTYFVSKIASEKVTVVLSGDGGDELFAGYPGYRAEYLLNRYRKTPFFLRNVIQGIFEHFPIKSSVGLNYKIQRIKNILKRVEMTAEQRFLSRHTCFDDKEKKILFKSDINNSLETPEDTENALNIDFHRTANSINKMLYLDTNIYLPNDMLVKVDRMSMANSLEVRNPFLDHKLAEYVATIPSGLKVKKGITKYILKKSFSKFIPKNILYRSKKGFSVPIDTWFRGDWGKIAYDMLLSNDSVSKKYLNENYISKIISSHRAGRVDLSEKIWTLLVFEIWYKNALKINQNKTSK